MSTITQLDVNNIKALLGSTEARLEEAVQRHTAAKARVAVAIRESKAAAEDRYRLAKLVREARADLSAAEAQLAAEQITFRLGDKVRIHGSTYIIAQFGDHAAKPFKIKLVLIAIDGGSPGNRWAEPVEWPKSPMTVKFTYDELPRLFGSVSQDEIERVK